MVAHDGARRQTVVLRITDKKNLIRSSHGSHGPADRTGFGPVGGFINLPLLALDLLPERSSGVVACSCSLVGRNERTPRRPVSTARLCHTARCVAFMYGLELMVNGIAWS